MARHRTLSALAKALGYVPSAVTNWRKQWATDEDPFPPKHADGYDEDEVRGWYARQQQLRADTAPVGNPDFRRAGPGHREPPSANLEQIRKFTAQIRRVQAMRAALELKREEGNLIDRSQVDGMLSARVLELNQGHEMMHRDIADQLAKMRDPRAIVALLDAEWIKLRQQYARGLPLPEAKNGHAPPPPPRREAGPQKNPTRERRRRRR